MNDALLLLLGLALGVTLQILYREALDYFEKIPQKNYCGTELHRPEDFGYLTCKRNKGHTGNHEAENVEWVLDKKKTY